MSFELNSNAFDQFTADRRDYTVWRAPLAMTAQDSGQSFFGLGWAEKSDAVNGELAKNIALARLRTNTVMESAMTLISSQCKQWSPDNELPAGPKESLQATEFEPKAMEVTYRVVLSLMENEQVSLARKALAALPAGQLSDPMVVRLRNMLAVPITKTSQKRDIDRTLDYQWIRDHAQDYRGQWVALDKGELLGAATSLRELLDRVKPLRSEHRPLLHQIS